MVTEIKTKEVNMTKREFKKMLNSNHSVIFHGTVEPEQGEINPIGGYIQLSDDEIIVYISSHDFDMTFDIGQIDTVYTEIVQYFNNQIASMVA